MLPQRHELTGCEAKTIHRLLEVEYRDGATEPSFVYNRKNKLDVDAVIIDELSMVDIKLFDSFLEALPMNARLIMVGDDFYAQSLHKQAQAPLHFQSNT